MQQTVYCVIVQGTVYETLLEPSFSLCRAPCDGCHAAGDEPT